MQIKNVESTSSWTFRVPILILGIYFLVILPCTQIFFRTHPWLYRYTDILFFTLVVLFALYKVDLAELGFSTKYLSQHLVMGVISGGLLLLSLPLLELGLEATGLTEHKIYAEKYKKDASYNLNFLLEKAIIVFFIPLIEQIFFTGLILQSLLKKTNPILAVYIVSLIYMLTGFNLTLGAFGVGIGTGLLYKLTGTLHASILFHISCAMGGELLLNAYPRLTVILGFLF